MDSKKLLDLTVEAIDERHGEDTEAYDMQGISILADYYVVTTAAQIVNFMQLLIALLIKFMNKEKKITVLKEHVILTGF